MYIYMSSEENFPGGGSYAHSEKGIPSIIFLRWSQRTSFKTKILPFKFSLQVFESSKTVVLGPTYNLLLLFFLKGKTPFAVTSQQYL